MVYTVNGVQYTRRKKIPVTGAASGAQTNFQIKLAAIWAAAMQADFDDVRFTKADMQTLIDVWLESKVNSTSANIWVEFPNTPVDGVEKTEAYMYFGNAGVASDWDIAATFIVGDDGETGSPSGSWVVQDTASIVIESTVVKYGSYALKVDTGANVQSAMHLAFSNRSSGVLEYYMRVPSNVASISGRFDDGALTDDKGTHFFYRGGLDKFQYYDTAYHDVQAASINTWYRVKLVVKSLSAYDIYIDDVLKISNANTRNSPANYDRINVGGYTANGIIYIDNLFVRKYAANPPTAAFGTEEHQRRTPMMM